jgi:tripartite-type tricarboxylate transporter receptor subunit TctC
MIRHIWSASWFRRSVAGFLTLLGLAATATAQHYPDRTVRIVSVTSPGTGVDDYTRLLANFLSQKLGQSFVVENRPGANSILAADHVAKAAPDGYTLLLGAASTMAANPALFKELPYSPNKDFLPIARMTALPIVMLVPANSPYRSIAELSAAARAQPGKLNYGTSSAGYRTLIAAFNDAVGIKTVDIPYKAMSNLLPDLMSGIVDFSVVEISAAVPHVQSGKLRALAVFSPERVPALSSIPTMEEAGVSGISLVSWTGLFAPANTPAEIIDKLSHHVLEFVTSPTAERHHVERGVTAFPATSAEFAKAIIADQQEWKRLIALAGIQPE